MILGSLLAQPVVAQSLSGAEFDAYTRGKTLFYGFGGTTYGVERYLPNRRVVWSFLDGDCKEGIWYEQNGQICFVYEDRPDPQCWVFYDEPGGLRAEFLGADGLSTLYQVDDLDEGLICPGPDVGV